MRALPARWYVDPEVLAAEHEAVFAPAWQYAGPAERVAEPGSFMTVRLGRVPVIVVRDRAGELRGLVNVCRHRAHAIAEGHGRCSTLQCPYHAWTYELDGRLRSAPRSADEPGLDLAGVALPQVAVGVWGPLVLARVAAAGETLEDALGELPGVVAATGLDIDSLRLHSRSEWSLDANWKVAIENYLECYHCQVAHPGLSKLFDVTPGAYGLHEHARFSYQTGPKRERRAAGTFVDRGDIAAAQWHWLWPNLTINVEAGPPNLSVDAWWPAGTGRTEGVTDYFFGPDVAPELADEVVAFSRGVGEEDALLVASVQRGLESGAIDEGRLMPRSERLVAHFQAMVRAALDGRGQAA